MKKPSLSETIYKLIEENPNVSLRAITVDRMLNGGKNYKKDKKRIQNIRVELARLAGRKKIRRMKQGYYRAVPRTSVVRKLENPEVKLHGIKLECQVINDTDLEIPRISSQISIKDWCNNNGYEPVFREGKTWLQRWNHNDYWDGRRYSVTIHQKGLIEIWVNSSDNPFEPIEFSRFVEFLNGHLKSLTPFRRRDVRLVQVGVARDFEHLRMEGVSCISLRKFMNDWIQIYQKKSKVRYEHHLTLDITLEDAFNSLQLLTTPVSVNGHRPDTLEDVV